MVSKEVLHDWLELELGSQEPVAVEEILLDFPKFMVANHPAEFGKYSLEVLL